MLNCIMDQPVLTRVQTRWMRLGLFQSISPMIKYHPGKKVNIITNALSRNQRSLMEVEKTEEGTFASLFTLTTHMEMDRGNATNGSQHTRQTHV